MFCITKRKNDIFFIEKSLIFKICLEYNFFYKIFTIKNFKIYEKFLTNKTLLKFFMDQFGEFF